MSMEIRDEAVEAATAANNSSSSSANSECSHPVVKGKRTKRQRIHHQSPAQAAAAASSTSSSGDLSGSTTEEDEDMANCLILLAQGRTQLGARPKSEATALKEDGGGGGGGERFTSRRLAEAAATNGKLGFYVYECKTCNKCFPSFQALGGHRSSHKKPKMAAAAAATTEEKQAIEEDNISRVSVNVSSPTILSGNTTTIRAAGTAALTSSTNNNASNNNKNNSGTVSNHNKSRVHECSICGSEFSSGQALGGHMRRHRPVVAMETQGAKKEKNILSLDLNLPAPTDDDRGGDYPKSPSFPFAGGQPLFSPSALVDCHY